MQLTKKRLFSIFLIFIILVTFLKVFAYDDNRVNLYINLYWNIDKEYIGSNWEYEDFATSENINYVNELLKERGGIDFTLYQNGIEIESRRIPMILMEKEGNLCTDQVFFGTYPIYSYETGKEYDYEIKSESFEINKTPISVSINMQDKEIESNLYGKIFNFSNNVSFSEVYDGSQGDESYIYNVTYPYKTFNMKVYWENGEPDNIDSVAIPLKGDGFVVENPTMTVLKENEWKQEDKFRYKADSDLTEIELNAPNIRGYKSDISISSCQPDSNYSPSINTNIDLIITMKRIGYFSIMDEYYVRDKDGNLTLEGISERKELEIAEKTEYSKDNIGMNTNYNNKEYTFFDYDGSFIAEVGKDTKLILKYVRDAEYVDYTIKHEYYVKDKDGKLTLENTLTEEGNKIEGYEIKASDFFKLVNDEKEYTVSENSGNMILDKKQSNNMTIKYIRDIKYFSFDIQHEYYVKDKDNKLTLENSISDTYESSENIQVHSKDYLKLNNNEKDYQFFEDSGSFVLTENNEKMIIKYVRDEKYISYEIKHEYYVRKNGKLTLENSVTEKKEDILNTEIKSSAIERKTTNNNLKYQFYEASGNLVLENNKENILTLKYVRDDLEEVRNGSYEIKYEYYVKDKDGKLKLENTVTEKKEGKLNTEVNSSNVEHKTKNNGKDYIFSESSNGIIIAENKTNILTLKYVRTEKYASYQIKHEYYVKDENGKLTLENTITETKEDILGSQINGSNIDRKLKNNGKEYKFLEITKDFILESSNNTMTLKYVREQEKAINKTEINKNETIKPNTSHNTNVNTNTTISNTTTMNNKDMVKTGDNTPIVMLVILFTLSGIGISYFKKKNS